MRAGQAQSLAAPSLPTAIILNKLLKSLATQFPCTLNKPSQWALVMMESQRVAGILQVLQKCIFTSCVGGESHNIISVYFEFSLKVKAFL
jgi:hypothetical protein